MTHTKLLIADCSEEFRQSLENALPEGYAVRTCRSGTQALELMRTFRPDILVTDLFLPELDGLTMLQMAFQEGLRPKVLVVSTLFSPYIHAALERLKIDYPMLKPCSLQALVWRIGDFAAASAPAAPAPISPEDWVANTLLRLGIGAHLDGFRFLKVAIPHFCKDTSQGITKELYTKVADTYGKDAKQVERSIRSAIDSAWKRRDNRVWAAYFPPGPDGDVPRFSNGKFIAHLAQLLCEETKHSHSA